MFVKKKISVVVSAFNEEKNLKKVLLALVESDLVNEVICVNDGSRDGSLEIIKSFGDQVGLVNLKKNKGKGYAMAVGVEKAQGKLIMFVDADLKNLNNTHIKTLLDPILNNKFRVSIGFYILSPDDVLFSFFLSGERVYFKKDLIGSLSLMKESRFGAEVLLNHKLKKLKTKRVLLKGLRVTSKQKKHGFLIGTKEIIMQVWEVSRQLFKLNFKKL